MGFMDNLKQKASAVGQDASSMAKSSNETLRLKKDRKSVV